MKDKVLTQPGNIVNELTKFGGINRHMNGAQITGGSSLPLRKYLIIACKTIKKKR